MSLDVSTTFGHHQAEIQAYNIQNALLIVEIFSLLLC